MIGKNRLEILLELIGRFLHSKTYHLYRSETVDPFIIHYYFEIIRNWNKLNYLIKKVLRSLNLGEFLDIFHQSLFFYFAYKIQFEKANIQDLLSELNLLILDEKVTENIQNLFEKFQNFSWEIALKNKNKIERLSIIASIPSFFIKKLQEVMNITFIEENLKYINNYKTKDFSTAFVNKNVDFILNSCFFKNFEDITTLSNQIFQKDSDIPYLYHIPKNYKNCINDSELYQSGDIIMLDKASASVVDILSPNSGESLLDMCAAPGVKTSIISHYLRGKAHHLAIDFSQLRTEEMRKFINRQNSQKLHILNSDAITPPFRSSLKFDKVLLDAPCTGSGALLSNPELKWRQNEKFLHQNMTLQEKLLNSAIELLKPSGILVYSTCSLYPEEGEYQIIKYLEKLKPQDLPDWLGNSYQVKGSKVPGTARLFPSQHHTEGFFIAKFKKK